MNACTSLSVTVQVEVEYISTHDTLNASPQSHSHNAQTLHLSPHSSWHQVTVSTTRNNSTGPCGVVQLKRPTVATRTTRSMPNAALKIAKLLILTPKPQTCVEASLVNAEQAETNAS